ncbi:MAG: VWA domain-containing protein [Candidatus Woesearchaeota archaeon]
MNILGMDISILNSIGIYAFIFLVPFILLYLIKPKTVTKTIPSLMFFLKEQKKSRKTSFFQRLRNNLIFLLQLLAILLLAFSVMNPILKSIDKSNSKNTFIIIDSSASMQTKTDGTTRFQKAVDIAKEKLNGNINLIQASNSIIVSVRDGWTSEARTRLNAIEAFDTAANIEGAMQRADQLLDKKNAKIIVISDFINVMGSFDDPLKAKRILTGKGNEVELIDVNSEAENIGIVNMVVSNDNAQVFVKNFNDEKKAIQLNVKQENNNLFEESRTILQRSTEIFTFETPQGESTVILSPEDDFVLDNKAYISTPTEQKIKVLLITSAKETYLKSALKASKIVDLVVKSPPFAIEDIKSINPQVILTNKLNKNEMIVGDFQGLAKLLSSGKSLIITAQEDMQEIDFDDKLPIEMIGIEEDTNINVIIENQFTKDVEFGRLSRYMKSSPKNGTTIILTSSDNSPLLSFDNYNNGSIVYYGIMDDETDFKTTPSYPIFWSNLIKHLVKTEDIRDYNKRIGEVQNYRKVGVIEEDGKRISVNLLDEEESDVGNQHEDFTEESNNFVVEKKDKIRNIPIETYLIIIAMVLLFLEILVVKKRGDL